MVNIEYIQDIVLKRIDTDGPGGPSVVVNGKKIPYINFSSFENFHKELDAIFTTRLGGVSDGDCYSLNLSFSRGDNSENVVENFRRVANELEISLNQFVFSNQTHTTNIKEVTQEDAGKGIMKPLDYEDIDGLMTNQPGLCLSLFFADCVPVYFYDPVHKAIGLAHSGWKGTVHQISQYMLEGMNQKYNTQPKDVLVVIGPSICPKCYEVSEDVAFEFQKNYDIDLNQLRDLNLMNMNSHILSKGKTKGKYQLNLWEAIRQTLLSQGVPYKHIQIPDICTCCNPQILFSHRASSGKRGNLGAFMMLKDCN